MFAAIVEALLVAASYDLLLMPHHDPRVCAAARKVAMSYVVGSSVLLG